MSADIVTLSVDGLEIPVTVVRKRVKNLNLRVRPNGTVTLSIPKHLPPDRARDFLERRGGWIAERVRRNIERGRELDVDSEPLDRIPLWGELVTRGPVQTGPGQGVLGQGVLGQGAIDQGAIDELYRSEVLRALPDVAEHMQERIGVHASRWSVRAMKTRWGSCTPKTGSIRINARLAAYPPACLEFVVAHELVHLLEPSHNARFHALLDEFCPDNRHLAKLLKSAPGPR